MTITPEIASASERIEKWHKVLALIKTGKDAKPPTDSSQLPVLADLIEDWQRDLVQAVETESNHELDAIGHSAMACLLVVLSHKEAAQTLTGAQVLTIIDTLSAIIADGRSSEIRRMALWAISTQRFHVDNALESKAEILVSAHVRCISRIPQDQLAEDALHTLHLVCVKSETAVKRASLWFGPVIRLLFSKDTAVAKQADTILCKLGPTLITGNDLQTSVSMPPLAGIADQQIIDEPKQGRHDDTTIALHNPGPPQPHTPPLQQFLAFLQKQVFDDENAIRAWGHIINAFGVKLHKTSALNKLLSLAEASFNGKRPSQRAAAHYAWRRLILNFSLEGHLFHPKRMRLVLVPIWSCLKFEKSQIARNAGLGTYLYLLFHVSQRRSYPSGFLQECVAPLCSCDLRSDRVSELLANAIANILSAPVAAVQQSIVLAIHDQSPEEICNKIGIIAPPAQWSQGDIFCILDLLKAFKFQLLQDSVPCIRIWKQVCAFVQFAWDAYPELVFEFVKRVVDVVDHTIQAFQAHRDVVLREYLPHLSAVRLARLNLSPKDITAISYILSPDREFSFIDSGHPAYDAWERFRNFHIDQNDSLKQLRKDVIDSTSACAPFGTKPADDFASISANDMNKSDTADLECKVVSKLAAGTANPLTAAMSAAIQPQSKSKLDPDATSEEDGLALRQPPESLRGASFQRTLKRGSPADSPDKDSVKHSRHAHSRSSGMHGNMLHSLDRSEASIPKDFSKPKESPCEQPASAQQGASMDLASVLPDALKMHGNVEQMSVSELVQTQCDLAKLLSLCSERLKSLL